MRRAMAEYQIVGVRTTLPFAYWLMEHPRFITADFSTDFLAQEWDGRSQGTAVLVGQEQERENDASPEKIAAIVGTLLLDEQLAQERLRRQSIATTEGETSRWRDASRREALRRL
jgi:acetyl/propionyl-CoA carboxylase alpha subunit